MINTIIPMQFAYAKSQGKEISEDLIQLMQQVEAEKNSIVEKFNNFGIQSRNALDSQSLLQLKNEYCNKSRCLRSRHTSKINCLRRLTARDDR